jgi:hypothetical protein
MAACAARDRDNDTARARRTLVARRLLAGRPMVTEQAQYFVVDLEEGELRDLESDAAAADRVLLADPTEAVGAFGAALGLPAVTHYELVERSNQAEEGAGAFVATFRATGGGSVLLLRLISQPDHAGRPTYWLLNDVERLPSTRSPGNRPTVEHD